MVAIDKDSIGEISLLRSTGKILGGLCHACKMAHTISEKEMGLVIDMDSLNVVLCSFHEGQLLEKLLTNYLKRKRRPHTVGFIGPLLKPVEEKKEN